MPTQQTTGILILATVVIWLVIDLWLYYSDHATISQLVWEWTRVSAAIVLAVGILVGHWFFPAERKDGGK